MKDQKVSDEIVALINNIVEMKIAELVELAKDKDQSLDEVYEELMVAIKKQFKMTLDNLYTLYESYIEPEESTIAVALQYIPLFAVYGLWIGAQMGVAQDEYYAIVDRYLKDYNLIEE